MTETNSRTDLSGKRAQPRLSERSIVVIAGEASGDLHAARVVRALHSKLPGTSFFGLGGQHLVEQGLDLLDNPECLNIVGLSEVLGGLSRILALRKKILHEVARRRPDAALLVDLPGFNLNLALHLRRLGVRVVYYIAPQAWAWRKGRVKKLRRRVDELCVIFPFEEKFFRNAGITTTYVGHPLIEKGIIAQRAQFASGKTLAIVPGSRPSEISRLLPPMAGAARILQLRSGPLDLVLPVAAGLDRNWIRSILAEAGVQARLVDGGATEALTGAKAAFVTSGTATVEAAIQGVPMVVVYRVSASTYAIVKAVYRLKHFCIVNILAGKTVVAELLQGDVRPDLMAKNIEPLLNEGPERQQVLVGLKNVVKRLQGPKPSDEVARIIIKVMEDNA